MVIHHLKHPLAAGIAWFVIGWGTPAFSGDLPGHQGYLVGPFENGISVTRACLDCHADAAEDILHSAHWLWRGPSPYVEGAEDRTDLGKRNLINNF